MTAREYVYRITDVVKVTDGDTYWFRVDCGFRHWALVNIRLLGWDCPEKNATDQHERNQAKVATLLAFGFLTEAEGQLWVRTQRDPDNFGRWLGDIWREDLTGETHLGDSLASEGLATKWPTRWHEVYVGGA